MLVTTESLLNSVYTFLESDDDLNPLQASFFSKVMGLVITRRSQMVNVHLLTHFAIDAITSWIWSVG